jgi:phosphoribosylformylglycinamidine synthase
LRAPGSNCDEETAHAFSLAGSIPERCHINRVLDHPERLTNFQVLCIPGGFSYGDDIGAGRILGNRLQHHLAAELDAFRAAGKLILGICNGFQVLLKTQLFAEPVEREFPATLALNDSGRFEDRWVRLAVVPGNCVFLHGISTLELPVAHAEGRFVVKHADVFRRLDAQGQFVMRYAAQSPPATSPLDGVRDSVPYPDNPNGAMGNVAGFCDPSGRVMPHPERFVDRTQHPRWTREPERDTGDGLRLFQNAVRYFL